MNLGHSDPSPQPFSHSNPLSLGQLHSPPRTVVCVWGVCIS